MYTLFFLDIIMKNLLLIFRVKHEKGYAICGLAWHPTCGRISYTDAEGNLGLLENVCDTSGKASVSKVTSNVHLHSWEGCMLRWTTDEDGESTAMPPWMCPMGTRSNEDGEGWGMGESGWDNYFHFFFSFCIWGWRGEQGRGPLLQPNHMGT